MTRHRIQHLDLARLSSAGGIASWLLLSLGVEAPLAKFALADAELSRWASTFHGGWIEADPSALDVPFVAAVLDVTSCFPLVAHQIGWWELLTARQLRHDVVTEPFRELCELAAEEPREVLRPRIWKRYGVVLVDGVVARGQPFPFELADTHRPDGRLEIVATHSERYPFAATGLQVLAACVLSASVPEFTVATRLTPVRPYWGLPERVQVLPGLSIHKGEDPAIVLGRFRSQLRREASHHQAELLSTVNNALVFGNLCRLDPVWVKRGGGFVESEAPGPYNFMPLASAVSSGAFLLLAILDRLVRDAGSHVVYRDTDSSIIPLDWDLA
jgi:hypothetical protein